MILCCAVALAFTTGYYALAYYYLKRENAQLFKERWQLRQTITWMDKRR